jgi:hypothetical protein
MEPVVAGFIVIRSKIAGVLDSSVITDFIENRTVDG